MLDSYEMAQGINVADWTEGRLIAHYEHSNIESAKRLALHEVLRTGHRIGVFYAWSKRLIIMYTSEPPVQYVDDDLF